MSPPAPSLLASLTDKEVEILHLLMAGHTVKSIAVQLGRSETSINERLRDARRKTGIGSSRELARLIAAQKSWDKNFDLSAGQSSTDAGVRPATAGPHWSKGTIAMLITLPLIAAGLIAVAADSAGPGTPTHPVAAAMVNPSPLVGRWSLDVARIPAEERPRRVTITFSPASDGKWVTVVEIIGADGASSRAESLARLDGVPVTISGNMGFIDAVSLRQPAPNTLVMTLSKNGAPVSTRVYTAAKDRKSMTETIVWAGNTVPKLETNRFDRID